MMDKINCPASGNVLLPRHGLRLHSLYQTFKSQRLEKLPESDGNLETPEML